MKKLQIGTKQWLAYVMAVCLGAGTFALVGCEQAEEAGEATGEAMEEAGQATEEAMEEAGDAVKEASREMSDSVEN